MDQKEHDRWYLLKDKPRPLQPKRTLARVVLSIGVFIETVVE